MLGSSRKKLCVTMCDNLCQEHTLFLRTVSCGHCRECSAESALQCDRHRESLTTPFCPKNLNPRLESRGAHTLWDPLWASLCGHSVATVPITRCGLLLGICRRRMYGTWCTCESGCDTPCVTRCVTHVVLGPLLTRGPHTPVAAGVSDCRTTVDDPGRPEESRSAESD